MQKNFFQIDQVPVNGERIKLARESRGLTQAALADAVGIDQTMIAHIERGTKQPGIELLGTLSYELEFSEQFFRLPNAARFERGSLLFRARAGVGKRILSRAHAQAALVFESILRLSHEVSLVPINLPTASDPIEAARIVRELMAAPAGPLDNLVRNIERLGVLILPLPQLEGCDAFAVWGGDSREYPTIGAVIDKPVDRVRMNIAHEVGHLVLHKDCSSGTEEMERQAYRFAAELLMPTAEITSDFRSEKLNLFRLASLKQKWNVSMQALARRARDLEFTSDRQYRYLMRQISMRGWRTIEPTFGKVDAEKPRAFTKLIEVAYGTPIDIGLISNALKLPEAFLIEVLSSCANAPVMTKRQQTRKSGEVLRFRGGRGL